MTSIVLLFASLVCLGGMLLLFAVGLALWRQNRQLDQEQQSLQLSTPAMSAKNVATDGKSLDNQFVELLSSGQKIEAIKRYRLVTGVGLKEAIEAVEEIERNA